MSVGTHREYPGLPEPLTRNLDRQLPVVNEQLLYWIQHGRIGVRPGIERIDGTTVHFTDGTFADYDSILWATGFRVTMPFLDPALLTRDGEVPLRVGAATVPVGTRRLYHGRAHQPARRAVPGVLHPVRADRALPGSRGPTPGPPRRCPRAVHEADRGVDILRPTWLAQVAAIERWLDRVERRHARRPSACRRRRGRGSGAGMNAVVVTGVGSGMGRCTAAAFAKAGWVVIGIDRAAEALGEVCAELGPALRPCAADVTDIDAVTRAIDDSIADDRLAAVANVAGIYPPTTLATASREAYRQIFDVNVLGTLNMIAAAVPHLRANGGGSIVNFASVDAFAVSPGQLLYSASKAAVVSLTKTLAVELAPEHIVVNAIAPGWVETPGNRATGRMADVVSTIPLGRVAAPQEIADWVVHLAEPGYLTGETIVLSGGSVMR